MAAERCQGIAKVLFKRLFVCGNTPHNTIVSLKTKTPKTVNWTMVHNNVFQMAMKMHVWCNGLFSIKLFKLRAEFKNKQVSSL